MPVNASSDDAFVVDRKRAVRARMRAVTRVIALDAERRAERSAEACGRLRDVVAGHLARRGQHGAKVLAFEPWRTEVDLTRFVAWCASEAIEVYVPRIDGALLTIEPGDLDPALLDVVVVPGLAFTADGQRLGRGGGHYDRFLPLLAPGCLRVGVAFAEQLLERLPLAAHDVALDAVVTA